MIQVRRVPPDDRGLGQNGGNGAFGAGFTLKQLLNKLEEHFPTFLPAEGSLTSHDNLRSDRLPSRYADTHLETLGPPDSLKGLLYSFAPGTKAESQKKRIWAGILIRNALPRWRGGRAWVRRAFFQLEENPNAAPVQKEVEGLSIVIAHAQDNDLSERRFSMRVLPQVVPKHRLVSLRISKEQLLNGLRNAFPEPLEGQGDLIRGPATPNSKYFSENNLAALSTLGADEDLLAVQYNYELCNDRKAAWDKNRQFALELIKNIFPDWPEVSEWLRNAIVVAELERGQETKTLLRGGIALRLLHSHGNISLTVFPEALLF